MYKEKKKASQPVIKIVATKVNLLLILNKGALAVTLLQHSILNLSSSCFSFIIIFLVTFSFSLFVVFLCLLNDTSNSLNISHVGLSLSLSLSLSPN